MFFQCPIYIIQLFSDIIHKLNITYCHKLGNGSPSLPLSPQSRQCLWHAFFRYDSRAVHPLRPHLYFFPIHASLFTMSERPSAKALNVNTPILAGVCEANSKLKTASGSFEQIGQSYTFSYKPCQLTDSVKTHYKQFSHSIGKTPDFCVCRTPALLIKIKQERSM